MIDKEEFLFIVDENNQPLDPVARSLAHKNGLWHRTTGIWVINKNKQILCHKRSMQKDTKPGFWGAFFGGHMSPQEAYIENGVNELSEELGITVRASNLIPYGVFKSDKPTHKEFQHVFGCILNTKIDSFKFEKEEIDQITWKVFEEVKTVLLEKPDPQWVHKPWDKEVLDWLTTL